MDATMTTHKLQRVDEALDFSLEDVRMQAISDMFEEFDSLYAILECEGLQFRAVAKGQRSHIRGRQRPVWIQHHGGREKESWLGALGHDNMSALIILFGRLTVRCFKDYQVRL
jgi:hypothetical protein